MAYEQELTQGLVTYPLDYYPIGYWPIFYTLLAPTPGYGPSGTPGVIVSDTTCNMWPASMWPNNYWTPTQWPECSFIGFNFGCDIEISVDLDTCLTNKIDLDQQNNVACQLITESVKAIDLVALAVHPIDLLQTKSIQTDLSRDLLVSVDLKQSSTHNINFESSEETYNEDYSYGLPEEVSNNEGLSLNLLANTNLLTPLSSSPLFPIDIQTVYSIQTDFCNSEDCGCLVPN